MKEKQNYLKKENIVNFSMVFIYLSPLLTVVGRNYYLFITTLVLFLMAYLWFDEKFYLILPIFIFFTNQLIGPYGLVIQRVYSFLLMLKLITSSELKIETRNIIPLFLLLIYGLLVMSVRDIRMAFSFVFDFTLIILYLGTYIRENLSLFLKHYVIATIICCIYGFLQMGNSLETAVQVGMEWVQITRFLGSFVDPNYLGFFINIGIFSIYSIKLFKSKVTEIIFLLIFYVSLLATLSNTAILCNILLTLLLIFLKKKFKIRNLFVIILTAISSYVLYNVALVVEIPILTDFAVRMSTQLPDMLNGNTSALTSSRSDIWLAHLSYFINQPIQNFLFGGNFITDFGLDSKFDVVSHQALIDMLLNFGLLGTLAFILSFLFRMYKKILNYIWHQNQESLAIVMVKSVWLFYAFGLSMFPAWNFNLFFFF